MRAVLFEAEGDAFTAGNDLGDFAAVAAGTLVARRYEGRHVFLSALARGTKPYVAAVHGLAVGVGVTMLMHCDLVYVAEDAQADDAVRESRAGSGSSFELAASPRASATRAPSQLFALGEPVDGKTAAAIGLANGSIACQQKCARKRSRLRRR